MKSSIRRTAFAVRLNAMVRLLLKGKIMDGHRLGKTNVWWYWKASKESDDPEKSVLPTIIFISNNHPNLKNYNKSIGGFMLCFGWWDWGVKLAVYWKK